MSRSKKEAILQTSALLAAAATTFFVYIKNRNGKITDVIPVPAAAEEAVLEQRVTAANMMLAFQLFKDIKSSPQYPS